MLDWSHEREHEESGRNRRIVMREWLMLDSGWMEF
jgi:hypothetical protein